MIALCFTQVLVLAVVWVDFNLAALQPRHGSTGGANLILPEKPT